MAMPKSTTNGQAAGPEAHKPENRRFVILLDGTWQSDRGERPPTNIVHLRDLILPRVETKTATIIQQIYYDAGVGTDGSPLKRLWDAATGGGLEDAVRAAYRFLCLNFTPGMEIYVFGFSRGAFSARSLVGYIHAAGLLKPEACGAENESRAWQFYRTPKRRRLPAEKLALAGLCWGEAGVRVNCLGVFDTVGMRGIPADAFRWRNARKYGFHDTDLSSIVDYAFHALALDEGRKHFSATLWSYSFHSSNRRVEQVWFPGTHSDVGGGIEDTHLSNIPLCWMTSRVQDCGLGLAFDLKRLAKIRERRDATFEFLGAKGPLSEASRHPNVRIVSQTKPAGRLRSFAGLPRFANPVNEAIHWSVFERMQEYDRYEPPNIDANVLRTIYVDGTTYDTAVVGRHERFLRWRKDEADYAEILELLPDWALDDFMRNAKAPATARWRGPGRISTDVERRSEQTAAIRLELAARHGVEVNAQAS
jgi:Uncharacterized alpha/beta hydrolase domain (DUF2235)